MGFFEKLWDIVKHVMATSMTTSIATTKLIFQMNTAFEEQFKSGMAQRLVKVSIGMGNDQFKHAMSNNFLISGFKMTIVNDEVLKESEARGLANYILENEYFVRQLMLLGFDTLIVKGKTTNSLFFKISDYGNLEGAFLNQ